METAENTAVAIYGVNLNLTPATFADEQSVLQIVQTVAQTVKAQIAVLDINNPKELKKLGGFAREVASVKARIEEYGKSLVEDTKKQLKVVDEKRALFKKEFDALRDEIRQPLTVFENAEKEKINAKNNVLALMRKYRDLFTPTANDLRQCLSEVEQVEPVNFGEFAEEIQAEKTKAINELNQLIEKQVEIEKQAEELQRLKEEQEKARIEAEKQAYAEEQARLAVEREKARQAEEEKAKQAEIARQTAEEECRKANIEHRRAINNIVLSDLMSVCGLDETTAKKIIQAVANLKIQYLRINY